MLNTVDAISHGKRCTDFDIVRVQKAKEQGFDEPVTAYLCRAFVKARAGVGVVFEHSRQDKTGVSLTVI